MSVSACLLYARAASQSLLMLRALSVALALSLPVMQVSPDSHASNHARARNASTNLHRSHPLFNIYI